MALPRGDLDGFGPRRPELARGGFKFLRDAANALVSDVLTPTAHDLRDSLRFLAWTEPLMYGADDLLRCF